MELNQEPVKYPDPIPFGTDSFDYHVLTDAVCKIKDVPGLICEIGVRTGGSTKLIIDELTVGRTLIGIDPYGGLPYTFDRELDHNISFTNEHYRNPSLPKIYEYAFNAGVNFCFQNMTSEQFMLRFADGVPVYQDGTEVIENNYALVFFDGSHMTGTVLAETIFFESRVKAGGMLVYDDYKLYGHEHIDSYLTERDWVSVSKTKQKVSYLRANR